MSTHSYVVLNCLCDATEHRGGCLRSETFSGYSLTVAKDAARKAGWAFKKEGYVERAYCPNRANRRKKD